MEGAGKVIPQGLKPLVFWQFGGTAEQLAEKVPEKGLFLSAVEL